LLFKITRKNTIGEKNSLLGAFAKLQIATISFAMSACPSFRLSAWHVF